MVNAVYEIIQHIYADILHQNASNVMNLDIWQILAQTKRILLIFANKDIKEV